MNRNLLLSLAYASALLIGSSTEQKESGTPALFSTKEAAEKAAQTFNCTGAHKMGEKWMPCEKHVDNDGNHQKLGGHGSHHNH